MATETIVITGAGSGVGAATALQMARPGRRLVLVARRRDALLAVADEVCRRGGEAQVTPCDVSDPAAVEEAFRQVEPGLRALVNAAAVPGGTVGGATAGDIIRLIGTNLIGTMLCARAAAVLMGRDSTIVNLGSLCVRLRDGGASLYVAAKLGVAGFTDAFRKELSPRGIRVVLVNPGQIASGMVTETEAQKQAMILDEAMLTPEEVAEAIRFCLEQPARVVVTEIELRPRAQSRL